MRRVLGVALAVSLAGCSGRRAVPSTWSCGSVPAGSSGIDVHLASSGAYRVSFACPSLTFAGDLGAPVVNVVQHVGDDGFGAFHEVSFDVVVDGVARAGSIRGYDEIPVVLFSDTRLATGPNGKPFPTFTSFPSAPHHAAYDDVPFAPLSFDSWSADSPWLFFDDSADAFVLSPASHFTNAALLHPGNAVSSGIDPSIAELPAGFTQQTVLVARTSIDAAWTLWGRALTAWAGKIRPADDATVELSHLGYWTDLGASYYYDFDPALGYEGTLTAVRDEFAQKGVPLGYMELDSWWYPKGASGTWSDAASGELTYDADPALFPDGLAGFQQSLGLPLVTQARWIDPASPYRDVVKMSNDVSVDPAFWDAVASRLAASGATLFEQDGLADRALPRTDNLQDQDEFLSTMAGAMESHGVSVQYSAPLPRHLLQSAGYRGVTTARVSPDRFGPARWTSFLYGSRFASAVGVWPWSDVVQSNDADDLMVATLSGGVVGVGDALGAVNAANLAKAARADGVLVKPDTALVPLDRSWLSDANGTGEPFVAASRTSFGKSEADYVVAFVNHGTASLRFSPSELGQTGPVAVYDAFRDRATFLDASGEFADSLPGTRGLYVVVPVGPSGIAFFGDTAMFASLGKTRIGWMSDDGTLSTRVVFAAGETSVTLRGMALAAPEVVAQAGSAGPVAWDAATGLFSVAVSPDVSGVAQIQLR